MMENGNSWLHCQIEGIVKYACGPSGQKEDLEALRNLVLELRQASDRVRAGDRAEDGCRQIRCGKQVVMNEPPPHQPPRTGKEWEHNGRAGDIPIEPGGDPSPFEEFPDVPLPEDEPYLNSDIDTRKVTVTFIKDETGAEMRRVDMTLPQLAEHIRFTTAASKMALPWLKLALFGNKRSENNSLRTNDNVLQITGIEVEHDAGEIAFGTALATILKAGGSAASSTRRRPTFPTSRSDGASCCRCRRTIRQRCGKNWSRASTACSAASSRPKASCCRRRIYTAASTTIPTTASR